MALGGTMSGAGGGIAAGAGCGTAAGGAVVFRGAQGTIIAWGIAAAG